MFVHGGFQGGQDDALLRQGRFQGDVHDPSVDQQSVTGGGMVLVHGSHEAGGARAIFGQGPMRREPEVGEVHHARDIGVPPLLRPRARKRGALEH